MAYFTLPGNLRYCPFVEVRSRARVGRERRAILRMPLASETVCRHDFLAFLLLPYPMLQIRTMRKVFLKRNDCLKRNSISALRPTRPPMTAWLPLISPLPARSESKKQRRATLEYSARLFWGQSGFSAYTNNFLSTFALCKRARKPGLLSHTPR